MTYLTPYCNCNCLVQLSGLSCPDSELVCSECIFNPFVWAKCVPYPYVDTALNKYRFESTYCVSPFKL